MDGAVPGRSQNFRYQGRSVYVVDDWLQPRTRGNGARRYNKGRNNASWQIINHCRESQGWSTACSGMSERDGKNQGEDLAQSKRARAGSLAIAD